MKKKSILIILPWLPYPLTSGGHQALYNGIVAIHKDMDVSLSFAVEDEYQYLDALEGFSSMLPNVTLYPYTGARELPMVQRGGSLSSHGTTDCFMQCSQEDIRSTG